MKCDRIFYRKNLKSPCSQMQNRTRFFLGISISTNFACHFCILLNLLNLLTNYLTVIRLEKSLKYFLFDTLLFPL